MTAMALQALAPYYGRNESVTKAVDKALECLSDLQNQDGGYASWETTNSESCSQVLTALTGLGIDPAADNRFIKNGNTVVQALLGFYVNGGGFRHVADGGINGMATEQGYYALAAYERYFNKKTSLYDMTDIQIKQESEKPQEPEDTEKPQESQKPENLQQGTVSADIPISKPSDSSNNNVSKEHTDKPDNGNIQNPQTSDSFDITLYFNLIILSLAGFAVITLAKRKGIQKVL